MLKYKSFAIQREEKGKLIYKMFIDYYVTLYDSYAIIAVLQLPNTREE